MLHGKKLLRLTFNIILGHRGRVGVGVDFCACLSSLSQWFLGQKQHRNIFSHHTHRLPKFGWILTYFNCEKNECQKIIMSLKMCFQGKMCKKCMFMHVYCPPTHSPTNLWPSFSWLLILENSRRVETPNLVIFHAWDGIFIMWSCGVQLVSATRWLKYIPRGSVWGFVSQGGRGRGAFDRNNLFKTRRCKFCCPV